MEKKIVDYCLAYDQAPKDLEREIRDLMFGGWQPLGGVAITIEEDGGWMYQAMVKYAD